MKKNKITAILLVAAILSALIGLTESILYYVGTSGVILEVVPQVIRNVVTCFAFSPGLSIHDAVTYMDKILNLSADTLQTAKINGLTCWTLVGSEIDASPIFRSFGENLTAYQCILKIFTHLYAAEIIIAPICSASALYTFFLNVYKQLIVKVFPLFWANKKIKKCMIIGTGKKIDELMTNKKADPDSEYVYISTLEKTDSDKISYLKKKIRYVTCDLVNCSDDELRDLLNKYDIEEMSGVVICEESDSANFSIYVRIMKYMKEHPEHSQKYQEMQVCCNCDNHSMTDLFINYYNAHRSEGCVAPKLFSTALMRANAILDQQPLTDPEDALPDQIRVLIAGFGHTGQNVLLNVLNQGIYSGKNGIIVDVIDHDIDINKEEFYKRLSEKYFTIDNNQCRIDSDKADGYLEINFHKMDIRGYEFQKIVEKNDYNYATISIDDVETCLQCMLMINQVITSKGKNMYPVVISLLSEPEITVFLNQEKDTYRNIVFVGTSQFYTVNHILAHDIEVPAKKYHNVYSKITPLSRKEFCENDTEDKTISWDAIPYYKKVESRQLSRHQRVKEDLFNRYDRDGNLQEQLENWFGPDGTILKQYGYRFVYDLSSEDLAEKLNEVPFLKEMGMMEHRRWCYSRAIDGWSYGKKKDESQKESPYMTPWDELCKSYPYMCVYDYMPLLLKVVEK